MRSFHFSAVRQVCGGVIDVVAAASGSWKLVKEEIDGGDFAVPGDDEIGSGVSRRLARDPMPHFWMWGNFGASDGMMHLALLGTGLHHYLLVEEPGSSFPLAPGSS